MKRFDEIWMNGSKASEVLVRINLPVVMGQREEHKNNQKGLNEAWAPRYRNAA